IADHIHFQHKFLIGMNTAENAKRDIVRMLQDQADPAARTRFKGRDLVNGLPAALELPLVICSRGRKDVAGITRMVRTCWARYRPN
ncbi:MAG: rod shape-determining protein, partial [Sphingomonadales bacterium]|nr:rod shape-determining protein [Sphingomonadales bacterium]